MLSRIKHAIDIKDWTKEEIANKLQEIVLKEQGLTWIRVEPLLIEYETVLDQPLKFNPSLRHSK